MNRTVFVCFWLLLLSFSSFSQEKLVELSSEMMIKSEYQKSLLKKETKTKSVVALTLPFIDDFSNYTGYPDEKLWLDNYAYVNQSYSINPPTVGVITLDAINNAGNLYPQASSRVFAADTLTSQYIRLDSIFSPTKRQLTPADSVYFSFYFQPGGGYGEAWERTGITPSSADSLLLEFYNPKTGEWNYIWSQNGIPLDSLLQNDYGFFKYVLIPVVNEDYFADNFQFRFRNYCSLDKNSKPGFAGNCDQWHLDYIRLENGRNAFDTAYHDIAFVNSAPSMLTNYQAMPAKQFNADEVKDSLQMQITNISNEKLSSQYQYHIFNQQKQEVELYDGGFANIDPFLPSHQYQTTPVHATPPVKYKFPALNGIEQVYTIVHIVKDGTTTDKRASNDTIRFEQVFGNFYAYDDGTAENGFGLVTTIGVATLAYRFVMNAPDTLTSVDLYFNQTENNGNVLPFRLVVWSNDNGMPGAVVYRSAATLKPEFKGLNKYVRYLLEQALFINGAIYVGLEQLSSDFINMGFDRNNNARDNIFYNTSGQWKQSLFSGALMMRPNFGWKGSLDGNEKTLQPSNQTFKIFPNPVSDGMVHIRPCDITETSSCQIKIINILGSEMMSLPYSETVDISALSKGVYILQIFNTKTKRLFSYKLIIAK